MYLGLDIGTSSVKGVLIDDRQKIVGIRHISPESITAARGLVRTGPGGLVEGHAEGRGAFEKSKAKSRGRR